MSDALLASQVVFRSRATEIGFSAAAIQGAVDEGIGNLGQFGFSTSFIPGPGQQDETPLKDLVRSLHGLAADADITRAQMTSIRRLYLEARIDYDIHLFYHKALEGFLQALRASRHTLWALRSCVE